MDRQERGSLLVEQEEAKKKHDELRTRLIQIGAYLEKIGSVLTKEPHDLVFRNAPSEFMAIPRHIREANVHLDDVDWGQFPDIHDIGRLLAELRTEEQRLSDLAQQLSAP